MIRCCRQARRYRLGIGWIDFLVLLMVNVSLSLVFHRCYLCCRRSRRSGHFAICVFWGGSHALLKLDIWLTLPAITVKGKTKAPVEEDDEEEELRKLQAEMAM